MTRTFLAELEKRSKPFVTVMGLALVGVVGWLDYATGRDLTFSLFYLIPISLVGWLMGRWPGILASVISALVRMIADMAEGHAYSQPFFYVWNSLIGLAFFVIVALRDNSFVDFIQTDGRHKQVRCGMDGRRKECRIGALGKVFEPTR